MKPEREIMSPGPDSSFLWHERRLAASPQHLWGPHYHPEYEFVLVLAGGGTHFVGDAIGHHRAGDLVFHSAYLPHAWYASPEVCLARPDARYVVVQFADDFMGAGFFAKPELAAIAALFERAKRGLFVTGKVRDRVARRLRKMGRQRGVERLISLLRCLEDLAHSPGAHPICSPGYRSGLTEKDTRLVNQVCGYILENYTRTVRLPEAAAHFHMASSTFARFFKRNTGKTLIEFVNALRVNRACQLLLSSDMTVSEVCYASGFNDPSYFGRKFRTLQGLLPKDYRRRFRPGSPG